MGYIYPELQIEACWMMPQFNIRAVIDGFENSTCSRTTGRWAVEDAG